MIGQQLIAFGRTITLLSLVASANIVNILYCHAEGVNSVIGGKKLIMEMKQAQVLSVRGVATAVTWASDGSRLAATSDYGRQLTVWDLTGRIISQFDRQGRGPYLENSLSFVDGSTFLLTPPAKSAPEDSSLTLWSVDTGKIVRNIPGPAPDRSYPTNSAYHFVVSADGKKAAVVPFKQDALNVELYYTKNWAPFREIIIEHHGVSSIAISKSGNEIALGTFLGELMIVNASSGVIRSTQKVFNVPDNNMIGALAFSPDGNFVAVGAGLGDGAHPTRNPVRVYAVADGALVNTYPGGSQPVRQFSWLLGGRALAFANDDKTVRIWDPNDSIDVISTLRFSSNVMSIAASPDGNLLAVTDDAHVSVFHLIP